MRQKRERHVACRERRGKRLIPLASECRSNDRLPPSWQVDDEDDEPAAPSAPGLPRSVGPIGQTPQGYYPSTLPPQSQRPAIARQPAEVDVVRPPADVSARPAAPGAAPPPSVATLPPEDQPETGEPKALDPKFKKQLVDYRGSEPAGTIIIDTTNKFLFLTLGGGKSLRYGIGVGREGFTWAGSERISVLRSPPLRFSRASVSGVSCPASALRPCLTRTRNPTPGNSRVCW